MDNKNVTVSGGLGFLGWLALIFITLKLLGVITWSWWWVLAPLWGGFVLVLLVLLFFFLAYAAIHFFLRR